MADFDKAYRTVRKNEGGYRNVSWDAGGETYKGVSRVYNPTWPGWAIIDAYKRTKALKTGDIIPDPALDRMVLDLFKQKYWTPNRLGLLNNDSLATLAFDMVINHGRGPIVINTAVNSVRPVSGGTLVSMDSIKAMNALPSQTYNAIAAARVKYVESLKNSLGADYAGVLARAKSFLGKFSGVAAATTGLVVLAIGFFF